MPADGNGRDPIGEDVRLTGLEARLRAATDAEKNRNGSTAPAPGRGYAQGSRVLTTLIAGPVFGGLIGWLLDGWLGTSPWLLLALVFLGFAGAIWNIVKISGQRAE